MGDKQNLAKESQLALKQDKLIAGANITIALDGKTISAANPTSVTVTPVYQAGTLVAAIVVNGNTTNIYAPAQHGDNSNQNLAAPFSASATYAVGDYVIYQENLYKCITAITTAAAWDATKWTRVLITNEMGSGSGGDYANQNIADTYDITSTYAVGDYVIFNSLLYKCITAVTTPGVWNSSYWAHVLVTDEMGSGGGSSVIPNPQDPATDTLTKIGINGTVYDIAGGGGGSGYTETTLWSGSETPSTAGTDINLSGNISDYDAIAIHVGNSSYTGDNIFLVSSLTIGDTYISTIYHGENLGAYFTYTSDTQINIKRQATSYPQTYTKVVGIEYGEGGGGSSYTEDTLWSNASGVESTENGVLISLTGNISDYDVIILNAGRDNGGGSGMRKIDAFYLVSDLVIGSSYLRMLNQNDDIHTYFFYTSDSSITIASAYVAYPWKLFSVKGLKFGGGGGTTVVPNPSGTPTDTLNTVQIGNVIYDLGGGSGSGYSETNLYAASSTSFVDIPLTWNWTDYDAYLFFCNDINSQTGNPWFITQGILTDLIGTQNTLTFYPYDNAGVNYYVTTTQLTAQWNSQGFYIKQIVGLNFGSGGGGGVSFDEDILFNTQTTVSSGSSIQLANNIFDYDLIIIDTSTGSYTDWREHIFMDVSQITLNTEYTRMVLRTSSETYGLRYKFTANDTIYAWGDGNRDMIIYKITAVKFNGSGGSGSVDYSTTEHKIGTWIDGSDLYERTYLYTGTGAANPFSTTIDTTGTRIKEIIPHYASFTYGGGQFGECIGTELTGNTFVAQYTGSVPPNLTVSSYLGNSTETYEVCFTIRYIKTT